MPSTTQSTDQCSSVDKCFDAVATLPTNVNDLPNEILIIIFSLVDYESVFSIEQVCERWHNLVYSAAVWENMKLVLSMKNYEHIKDNVLPKVTTNLKIVKLQYFKFYTHIRVPLMSLCPNLSQLEISISQVDHCIFDDLKNWPALRFLSFRNSLISRGIDESERQYVFSIPFENLLNLRSIFLSNFGLTRTSLNSMLQCDYLCHVNIEKMKNIPADFLESFISSKKHILKDLCIYGDTLTDYTVQLIAQCTHLDTLHITTCKNLFDSSLFYLGSLTGLKSLKLRHGYFSTSALRNLFSNMFQRLTFLSLSRCLHVTLQVAVLIKTNAPNLTELSFYQCPFVIDKSFHRSQLEEIFSIPILLD